MRTKNIFKALALAMLMPAMLLTTACSNEDDLTNNTVNSQPVANKGYALPVTVNVTRQGDGTRATYNESTRKLEFSAGDKLFVSGIDNSVGGAGQFAGELTWQSGGTFSGTIYTQKEWTGTPNALFTAASAGNNLDATLLPAGYNSYNFLSISEESPASYDDEVRANVSYAFVASGTAKATGVEQLSLEQASTYSDGFALAPVCAILNFTISGLAAETQNVTLWINHGSDYSVTGSVTPNASGVATFAIGVPGGFNIKDGSNNLTVGSSNFTLPSSTTFAAGKIYNITRVANAINGKFSVSDTKKVYFSQGNLQYDGTNWKFAEHQYDCLGAGGTGTSGTATSLPMDLFTWCIIDNPTYGGNTYTSGTANLTSDTDWGSRMGSGWRTLTGGSGGEWEYLFNTRTTATTNMPTGTNSSAARYTKATVAGVPGVILFPDNYAHPAGVNVTVSDAAYNTGTKAYTTFTVDADNWVTMQSAGCVFLPAAGHRNDTSVNNVGSHGRYWSSTAGAGSAYSLDFDSNIVNPADNNYRNFGFSVRLVRPVQGAAAPAPEEDFVTFTYGTNTVKVAKMNLGATSIADGTASYGNYYAWGATETFGTVSYTAYNAGTVTATTGHDGGYSQNNAPYWNGSAYTKYTGTSSATLEAADDAVAVNMPGWHMPTQAEFQTLYAACGGTGTSMTPSSISSGAAYAKGIYWVTGGGAEVTIGSDTYKVNGLLFVQDADTHVFFPAAGYIYDTNLKNAGSYGYYRSSSLDTSNPNYANYAYVLFFGSAAVNPEIFSYRDYGYSVRPFKD